MSDELDKLEAAVTGKDENFFIELSLNKTNSERVKLRDDYKAKFGRDLLEDFGKILNPIFSRLSLVYSKLQQNTTRIFYITL